ncbi:quercetin dioxygenase-like cupin family protein [Luteibacter rhizovicinus]|uniref:Quercetin dioxygenase-like cupin family protein n=1 Tax=Luteibacter rhizovicinus TaxID=242606 RepID=A0A4R3YJ21_9GAMM|nr:cupin domain-containing protein [Luteibacter rhizovicinus]TCV92052.1 quercetin dioxygenase-like cupin family protein [Luteibacter rhizovicinus]
MNHPAPSLSDYLPARIAGTAGIPWIPMSAQKSWKPLRFFADDRGFVELLRMEPGAVMPLHRHTGEIHAFNLAGQRQLCTGEIIGPGDYVYEPNGNRDWWKVVGDEPMTALVIVMGTVEFVGPGDVVRARASASTQLEAYRSYCAEHGLAVLDLVD